MGANSSVIWNIFSQCTEVRFASFFPGGFTTMAVINPLEKKLANHTSVHCKKIFQITDEFAPTHIFSTFSSKINEFERKKSEKNEKIPKT